MSHNNLGLILKARQTNEEFEGGEWLDQVCAFPNQMLDERQDLTEDGAPRLEATA